MQILRRFRISIAIAVLVISVGVVLNLRKNGNPLFFASRISKPLSEIGEVKYEPRNSAESSILELLGRNITPWKPDATLEEISDCWDKVAERSIAKIERRLQERPPLKDQLSSMMTEASILNADGKPREAYIVYEKIQALIDGNKTWSSKMYYSVLFQKGVTALRIGENENCIMCRGESSCILPILAAAVHKQPEGSQLAIRHFTEYLDKFPDDLGVRWLLNIAHMTLAEHPKKVDPRFLISLDKFCDSEFEIGKFRDVGQLVGVNRFNQAGGAIMEDFDNDGLLDLVTTSMDPTCPMSVLRNAGNGTFEDITKSSGVTNQLGGLNCVQTDFNNDGRMDIFVIRGAWIPIAIRPSLLRQEMDGKFTDVTEQAGLLSPGNSIAASWSDYDNDGWLDLFVCCERQSSRLYHNLGNGAFEDVAVHAGVNTLDSDHCKGVAWLDFDNDGFSDLFQTFFSGKPARLFRNQRDGTFKDVSESQNIVGPKAGFSCWAWDYDNDGWLDIFATSYEQSLADVVLGLQGQPHSRDSNRLYRNLGGTGFLDVTKQAGLDMVFATMGSNFGDFDNDGYLDMYLGTGDPNLGTLVPNRMFRNLDGERFVEITASSRTGHLQKGHGVACGDWDRDGNIDIFMETGGAVNGDKYHNVLFQNPGHSNHWLTVKLTGDKSNRPAIGARIKVVTAGANPKIFFRHVSSGSSFGANPLEQTIGLGKAGRIALLEIFWPTSQTTQVFRDVAVDQNISITEFHDEYKVLGTKKITLPQSSTVNTAAN